MPVTRGDVTDACRQATQRRLKARRPKRETWPDEKKLGRDNGDGYNFKESTIGTLAREVYGLMAADPTLSEIAEKIVFPPGFPRSDFLEQDVRYFRRWIVSDVCTQAKIPDAAAVAGASS